MNIGCDIDGVLADFIPAFNAQFKARFDIDLPAEPTTWNYHRDAGVTKPQDDEVWKFIKASNFWANLQILPDARKAINILWSRARVDGDGVYFITTRPGRWAKYLTEQWLVWHGFPVPTVLISAHKGPVAAGLELDVFIDDKWENCFDVKDARGDDCDVFLVDRAYNRVYQNDICGIHRVPSALDALERFDEQSLDCAA